MRKCGKLKESSLYLLLYTCMIHIDLFSAVCTCMYIAYALNAPQIKSQQQRVQFWRELVFSELKRTDLVPLVPSALWAVRNFKEESQGQLSRCKDSARKTQLQTLKSALKLIFLVNFTKNFPRITCKSIEIIKIYKSICL